MKNQEKTIHIILLVVLLAVFFLFCVFSYKKIQSENQKKQILTADNELFINANNKKHVQVMLVDKETN